MVIIKENNLPRFSLFLIISDIILCIIVRNWFQGMFQNPKIWRIGGRTVKIDSFRFCFLLTSWFHCLISEIHFIMMIKSKQDTFVACSIIINVSWCNWHFSYNYAYCIIYKKRTSKLLWQISKTFLQISNTSIFDNVKK